jgi:acetylornithine deacetylase
MNNTLEIKELSDKAICLLKEIIKIPACSFEEKKKSDYIFKYILGEVEAINKNANAASCKCITTLQKSQIKNASAVTVKHINNNIIAYRNDFSKDKKTLMLSAHIDTVKAADSYTVDPYGANEMGDKIIGLGSNDDGAGLVSLTETFFYFCRHNANVNILLALSTEEERSGKGGMTAIIKELHKSANKNIKPDFAIVGEPTKMNPAIAERGLLVLDGVATGRSGHAARNEGINALYIAADDIQALRKYKFKRNSKLMGDVKLTITQINAGTAHNVVPDSCTFVIDIRPTEKYENEEIWKMLQKNVKSKLTPRSLEHKVSSTPANHPLLKCIKKQGLKPFISPTSSDWTRMDIPAIKMGPGDSARSHRADEFIFKGEIKEGIKKYIDFINSL